MPRGKKGRLRKRRSGLHKGQVASQTTTLSEIEKHQTEGITRFLRHSWSLLKSLSGDVYFFGRITVRERNEDLRRRESNAANEGA